MVVRLGKSDGAQERWGGEGIGVQISVGGESLSLSGMISGC